MNDPRLNSIHLEALPRRQEFRQAREKLLGARGQQTIAAERAKPFISPVDSPGTLIRNQPCQAQPLVKFLLMDKDYVYPLKIGLNTVGRMPDNDVVIDDGYVSRRHCAVLVHSDDRCELHDVASKNGTFLNGQKIEGPTCLKSGDEIRMCTKNLVFVSRASDPAGPSTHGTMAE